jgi:UrcA family protein
MTAIRIVIASALITAAALKAVPALAETSAARVDVSIVHTADLDLSSEAGKRRLEHRLANAAREVCGTASDVDLQGRNDVRACRSDVLAKARSEGAELAGRGAPITVAAGR